MVRNKIFRRTFILIGMIVFSALPVRTTDAQKDEPLWQPVTMLGGDQTPAKWPTVTIDPYKRVHVFWTQTFEGQDFGSYTYLIMHTMKTANGGWSTPTDIIIRDFWGNSLPHSITANGRIYLIWAEWSGLYFSSAPLLGSDSAANWQKKQLIVQQEGISFNSIIIDKVGIMHVVFSTLGPPNINADGNVYYLMSPDGGNFWTSPQKISNVTDPKNVVSTDPHLAIDSRGELFAVWAEARNVTFWRERAIFFTKSNDNGENWEVPIIVSEPNPTQELWEAAPTIGIDVEDNIHLVWTCGNVTNRCYRYSSNHGASWEQIERILTPFESLAGWDSMIVTPIGDLYLLAQMRQPMNVYYSVKPLNGNWIGPTPISNNPEIQDAHFLESTSDGERLFVVFQQSDAEGPIWYTEGWLTNKISFPLIPEFTTTSQIVSTITPQTQTNEPTNSPSPKVTIRDFGDSAPTQWPLIISVITPVLLIVSILLLKHFLGIHKNN